MSAIGHLVTLSIAATLLALAAGAAVTIVAALRVGGRREDAVDPHSALAESRFTIPVSIVVPAVDDGAPVDRAVTALLAVNYPEFEIIVVATRPSSGLLARLTAEWQLEAREFFYRQTLATGPVHRIYRSGRDGRVMVIDKAAGSHSDALNCGVNVARYRYVVAVAPEIVFDPDALLRMMSAALRDPAAVVAASSHLDQGEGSSARAAFEQLAATRALMESRLYPHQLPSGLSPRAAVIVWRRDEVTGLGGFSSHSADSNLDLALRVLGSREGQPGRFARGTNVFGRIDDTGTASAFRVAMLRQRAALEVFASWLRGGATRIEPRALWHFLRTELVAPLAELWVVAAALGGVAAGWYSWTVLALLAVMLSFGHAAVSAAALLLRGSAPGAPEGPNLARLIAMGPLEFACHKPRLAAARLAGTAGFIGARLGRREPAPARV